MTNLEREDFEVVFSVVEKFLDRAGHNATTGEGWAGSLGEVFSEFGRILKSTGIRRPDTKFSIVAPIKRPKLNWYQNMYNGIVHTFQEVISGLRLSNLTRVEGIPEGCQQFEPDQIHLTEAAGQIFLEGILSKSETAAGRSR